MSGQPVAGNPAVAQQQAAAATVAVSGTVTDGSEHGWPLYARLDVTGLSGGPVFTDPVTGRYAFQATPGDTYRVTATARYPGYRTASQEIAVGSDPVVRDIALPVDPGCTANGYAGEWDTPMLTEPFDTAQAPAGWRVVNRTASGGWGFTDLVERHNLTGGDGGFAIVDSDALGSGNSQDTDLISPSLDLSGSAAPFVRFNSDWRAVGAGSDIADVDVSVDAGATWTNVWHQTASRRGPRVEEVALTPAAGAGAALVRFHFRGAFAWWWQVDNIELVNRSCVAVPGGLVVGATTDRNTGTPLNGVTVVSDDAATDQAVSAATPDDPNTPDGFYSLFSSRTGAHPLTAAKSPYEPLTAQGTVPANGAVRADFALAASRLTVSPTAIGTFQPYDSTRTSTVTITNTGTAAAKVNLLERQGGFTILSALQKEGAKLVTRKVPGGVSKAMHEPTKAADRRAATTAAGAAAAPAVDDAWTRIGDYPVDVFDNAAATINGKVYSVGGGTDTGTEGSAYVYDPAGNAWSALPDLPTPRVKPQAAAVGDRLYVFGGWSADGTPVATVDVFDPAGGAWSTLSGTNPQPRAAAAAAVVDDKIYLVGGCTDAECTDSADVQRFDPAAGSFVPVADYPHASSWLSCGGVAGKVYCAGGLGTEEFIDGYAYDPAGDGWSRIADLPLQLWGSAHGAVDGLFIIMGGVSEDSTVLTNRTVAYDPTTDTWLDLPNAQFPLFRGAGACGLFKIGGSPGSFVGSAQSERLGGLGECTQQATDAPWLTTDPASFVLAPGASQAVTVSLTATAAAGVAQPGTYTAGLSVSSNTPYPVSSVNVSMTALPPPSAGKLVGTVQGRSCAGQLVTLPATLRVNSVATPGTGYTLVAGRDGKYAIWLPRGRYDVIVAKDGWVPEVQRIQITAGSVLTHDVPLTPVSPC